MRRFICRVSEFAFYEISGAATVILSWMGQVASRFTYVVSVKMVARSSSVPGLLSSSQANSYLCWDMHVGKWLTTMMATKSLSGVAPEDDVREFTLQSPL